jgi:very-short-patch-repair endonuclease
VIHVDEKKTRVRYDAESLKKRGFVFTGRHLPYNPDAVKKAKALREQMTEPEKKLWYQFLNKFEPRFLRQRPIDNYIADFYCPAMSLVIEIDGSGHFFESGKKYDRERTKVFEAYGLQVLRIKNEDVATSFETVCNKIKEVISLHSLQPPLTRGE